MRKIIFSLCMLAFMGLSQSAKAQTVVDQGDCGDEYPNNLTWVLMSDSTFTVSGVGNMQSLFADEGSWSTYLSHIKTIIINEGVTSIGNNAFLWSPNLISVSLPTTLTSIGEKAFAYCMELPSITIPNNVAWIGERAFLECHNLASITLPSGISSIEPYTFYYCYSLTSIMLPNSVTSIGEAAFSNCNNLTSINLHNNITSIGMQAFIECGFTSIVIPNSITVLKSQVFAWCPSLTFVTIPNSVTDIESWAFMECNALSDVKVSWTNPSMVLVDGNAFFLEEGVSNVNLHVPQGTVALYVAAPVWQDFNIVTGSISGSVTHADLTPLYQGGRMLLYKVQPGGKYPCVDTVYIGELNGKYIFLDVMDGDYLIRAEASEYDGQCAIPTYYGDVVNWDSANIIQVRSNTPFISMDITMVPCITTTAGNAFIRGIVLEDDGRKAQKPAPDIDVYLDKSESKDKWHTVSQTKTDTAGAFVFEDLEGDMYYRVRLDIPGLLIDTVFHLMDMDSADVVLVIQTPDNSIRPLKEKKIKVYPNPTTGQLIIDSGELTIDNVEIYDIYGRKIVHYQLSTVHSIDISHLANGMYFLRMGRQTVKIIKN